MTVPASPFQRILGRSFGELAGPVRRLHSLTVATTATGLADVKVAAGQIPLLICWSAGLPKAGRQIQVSVNFQPDGNGSELWSRQFVGRKYASTFRVEHRANEDLLVEQFGPFRLEFRIRVNADSLSWLLVGVRCIGVRAPKWAVPKVRCSESSDGDRYLFDIDAALPLIGPLIHYRGWLS